jgi:hypothetical protein
MHPNETYEPPNLPLYSELKFLRPHIIAVIEEALNQVGPFGEVQLVVEKGRLRYIRTIKSESLERMKL